MGKETIKDLTGQRFGRLTVVSKTDERKDRCVVWKCICDCGNEHFVISRSLLGGKTRSCGCLWNETKGTGRISHHMSDTKLYKKWCGMKRRCYYTSHKSYKDYGGRGITVCDEWKNDFQAFYDYVSKLPHFGEEGYSLDRINNNGNYEPENVRWTTQKEQCANRRNRTERK